MKKILVSLLFFSSLFSLDVKKAYSDSFNYEKMGKYEEAIKVLIPVYNKYKKGYTLNLRLAWLFYLNKNYNNAIKYYQKASLIIPSSFEAKLGLMRVYSKTNDLTKLLILGDTILKQDYYNYYANLYEINALIQLKNLKTALGLTNKMLQIYPTDIQYLTLLGKIYDKMGYGATAQGVFNNILILDPNNVAAKEYLNR